MAEVKDDKKLEEKIIDIDLEDIEIMPPDRPGPFDTDETLSHEAYQGFMKSAFAEMTADSYSYNPLDDTYLKPDGKIPSQAEVDVYFKSITQETQDPRLIEPEKKGFFSNFVENVKGFFISKKDEPSIPDSTRNIEPSEGLKQAIAEIKAKIEPDEIQGHNSIELNSESKLEELTKELEQKESAYDLAKVEESDTRPKAKSDPSLLIPFDTYPGGNAYKTAYHVNKLSQHTPKEVLPSGEYQVVNGIEDPFAQGQILDAVEHPAQDIAQTTETTPSHVRMDSFDYSTIPPESFYTKPMAEPTYEKSDVKTEYVNGVINGTNKSAIPIKNSEFSFVNIRNASADIARENSLIHVDRYQSILKQLSEKKDSIKLWPEEAVAFGFFSKDQSNKILLALEKKEIVQIQQRAPEENSEYREKLSSNIYRNSLEKSGITDPEIATQEMENYLNRDQDYHNPKGELPEAETVPKNDWEK